MPDGYQTPLNPADCLALASALKLAQLPELRAYITEICWGPVFFPADPDTFTARVPWFHFANGAAENAAWVAEPFAGNNYAVAVKAALLEIQGTMTTYGQGLSSNPLLTPVAGMSPVPAPAPDPAVQASAAPAAPAAAAKGPIGLLLPDGQYADLSGNSLPIGAPGTAPDGTKCVKGGTQTPFGMAYWWTPVKGA